MSDVSSSMIPYHPPPRPPPPAPAETATAQVRNAYRLRSVKAYSLIALSVDKSLQVHITSTTDPRIAWETLQKQFEFVSITKLIFQFL